MNKLQELTEQLNAEIKANFESGKYEITSKSSIFYMIKMEGIEAEIYTLSDTSTVELHQPLGGIVKYSLGEFDLYVDKVKAHQNKTKSARIAELEKELKEVQNG